MDNEVKGDGNSYTTEFRQLDPRLGRWLSIDPVKNHSSSPYTSMENSPILLNDITGLYGEDAADRKVERAKKKGYNAEKVAQLRLKLS